MFRLRILAPALALFVMAISPAVPSASGQGSPNPSNDGKLRIFFVDVEGGQATLFVPSGGQSLLIDTGWPGHDGRDARRIKDAAKEAGISRIDYVLITHYHDDHVGGVPQLIKEIPVGTFIDHGPNRELDHGATEHNYTAYQQTIASSGAAHIVAKAGDSLPVGGLEVKVLSADGNVLQTSLPGGGQPNSFCASSDLRPADQTENARSLGILVSFGRLKILDLGDLTWDKERTLMCPVNRPGPVDINIVSHHGFYQSSSPALIDATRARVAIMDNGETKGGSSATLKTLSAAPGLERLWQLHFSTEGAALNVAAPYIANPAGTDNGAFLELTATAQGDFEVRNSRTGFAEHYAAR